MSDLDDMVLIMGLFGLGFLMYKGSKAIEESKDWLNEEVLEPIEKLKAGTSSHYSPYSQRIFSPHYLRQGSPLWRLLNG